LPLNKVRYGGIQQIPYYIEDLKPGMSESFTKTVTERDIELFGEVSGDVNPVHFDEEFAKGTIFRGRIAHGVLSASYISTVLGMKMPGP
jgi:3-hydroxybutyryl-CoA dehydratase